MKQADPITAYQRARLPAHGTATRDELLGLPACAQPRDRTQLAAWAAETRRLLAESPLRSLMSAAIEARRVVESGACSREDGVRGAGRGWVGVGVIRDGERASERRQGRRIGA